MKHERKTMAIRNRGLVGGMYAVIADKRFIIMKGFAVGAEGR